MKKLLALAAAVLVLSTSAQALEVSAPSALLMEKETGTVLYAKDEHHKLEPASVTKVMTILLTMEAIVEGGRDLAVSGYSQETVDYLSQLPETSYLAVWVHFPERLNPIGFAQLEAAYDGYCAQGILSFRWAAVRTAEKNQLIGYQTEDCPYLDAAPDQERYPMFSYTQMWEEMVGRSFTEKSNAQFEGSAAKEHFITLLSYLADRPEAVEALAGPVVSYEFASIRDYVEENGVEIYGALVYAQPSALLQMWEDGVIDGLSIQQVLPSRYSGSTGIRQ